MILGKLPIIFIITTARYLFTESYKVTANVKECDPNRVYRKDDVTCICGSDGQWPHQNCSIVFNTKFEEICEPGSYVIVDCNICRCSKRGNIEKGLCTQHICDEDFKNSFARRKSSYSSQKCEPNHWYALSTCQFCYCVSKNELLCNGDMYKQRRVNLGKHDLTDCGTTFLSNVIKLFSVQNPSKLDYEEQQSNIIREQSEVKAAEIELNREDNIAKQYMSPIFFNHDNNKGDEELEVQKKDNKSNSKGMSVENNSGAENAPKLTEGKPIGRIAANTAIPFSNEKDYIDNDSEDKENLSLSRESENEFDSGHTEIEDLDRMDAKISKQEHDNVIKKNESSETQDSKTILRVEIPDVLKKVFNFGRRSMVSLENADCVPGSTVLVRCNTCFCLKNGKMLCTKKKCM